jgi:hypothetical protein
MKIVYYSILVLAIFLTSCGSNESESAASNESKSADRAKEMCECLQDAGLDNSITISKLGDRRFQRDLERKMEKIVPKCLLRIVKKMEEEISDLSKNDKKEYTKAFLKACIDSECTDITLDLIPYDLLGLALEEAESEINGQRRYRNEYEDYDEYYDEYDEIEDAIIELEDALEDYDEYDEYE